LPSSVNIRHACDGQLPFACKTMMEQLYQLIRQILAYVAFGKELCENKIFASVKKWPPGIMGSRVIRAMQGASRMMGTIRLKASSLGTSVALRMVLRSNLIGCDIINHVS